MRCKRCSGLMVVEPLYDSMGCSVSGNLQEVRCLNCGNVEDAVISINRLEPRSTRSIVRHNIGVEMGWAW